MIYSDLSIYYEQIEDYEKALSQLNNISEWNENTSILKASLFIEMQQYDSAFHYLNIGIQSQDIFIKTSAYDYLSELESLMGNYEKAHFYENLYIKYKDSIDISTQTDEINAFYHKSNAEIIISEIESKYKKITRIIFFSFITILFIATVLIILRNLKKKTIQRNQELELLKKKEELIQLGQKNYYTVLKQIINFQCNQFKGIPIFSRITDLNSQINNQKATLTYKEQDILKDELYKIFNTSINKFQIRCPTLTEGDMIYCCLSLLKLSNSAISICFGSSDKNKIKQRKFRIKEKMTKETNNSDLFTFIFN
jgi:tetratricopeptide (TPR) repeat protein